MSPVHFVYLISITCKYDLTHFILASQNEISYQFQPTEQEAIFIGLLETGIIEVLVREDEEQLLELEDEIDVFPRFGIPIPRFDTELPRSRRGVDRKCLAMHTSYFHFLKCEFLLSECCYVKGL